MQMVRHMTSAAVALLVFTASLMAADKDIKGKIVKVDPAKKTITVETDDGKKDYSTTTDTKVFGQRGSESKDGLKDDRLTVGTEVKLVIAGNNRTAREIHIVKVAGQEEPANTPRRAAKDIKDGMKVKIVHVDLDGETITVSTEAGKKTTYSVGSDTQFIGPRGGVSKLKIRDDRVAIGNEITVVLGTGKTLKEVHLPYRAREKKSDKDK